MIAAHVDETKQFGEQARQGNNVQRYGLTGDSIYFYFYEISFSIRTSSGRLSPIENDKREDLDDRRQAILL